MSVDPLILNDVVLLARALSLAFETQKSNPATRHDDPWVFGEKENAGQVRRKAVRSFATEVESLEQLEEALVARPDIVMLDNFALADLRTAVSRNRQLGAPVRLEASGGASLETVRAIADTGVDFISVGAITKHVHAIDLSMRLEFLA